MKQKLFIAVITLLLISWVSPYAVLAISVFNSGCGMSNCHCNMNSCCCDMGEKDHNEIKQVSCDCILTPAAVPETQAYVFSSSDNSKYIGKLFKYNHKTELPFKPFIEVTLTPCLYTKNVPLFVLDASFLI